MPTRHRDWDGSDMRLRIVEWTLQRSIDVAGNATLPDFYPTTSEPQPGDRLMVRNATRR